MSEYFLSNLEPLIVKPGQHIKDALAEYEARHIQPDVGIVDPPKRELIGTWNGLPIYGSPMDHAWEPQFPTLAARMAADPTQDWT